MRHLSAPRLLSAAVILLVVAACTPVSDQPSAEEALCDSLAAFADSVQAIADLSPETASIDDLKAAGVAAQGAWDQVLTDAEAVPEADEAALDAAWSALGTAIVNLPTDVPVFEAIGGIQAAVDDVQGTYTEMRDGVGCA